MQTNTHVGRLVRVPNIVVKGEKMIKIAYFKLAINDLSEGKATFIEYVAFNKTADLVEKYLNQKGQMVEVQFVMRNRNYINSQTNEKVYSIQNIVTQFRNYTPLKKAENVNQSETDSIDQMSENHILNNDFDPAEYGFPED
ncbi:single-stranded DNA-binding protein [Leuconostoc gelidum subsp. gelidum]|uniref:single-stranded DNA-binding protein n=1 Tax=Leuconostoc gelidum TaxID=1244 RepID=UPI001CC336BA|nr:single-stranded DNA-binding protein [Leuconostoc gelidum]MBZ5977823.1 single-stranded DNA-binding protein [Leuconostoc gelidum subsp. gelidum]MBZ6001856.1 single-stranded DNA-binding protein [Leuconostoc gelidum subsp. gelidum]